VELVHHEGCVPVHVADAAADLHVVRDHREEGQQADDQQEDVHHGLPQPIAHLEEEELPRHATPVSALLRLMAPKKTSSRLGSTGTKPSPGRSSLSRWITGVPATSLLLMSLPLAA